MSIEPTEKKRIHLVFAAAVLIGGLVLLFTTELASTGAAENTPEAAETAENG